MPPPTYLSTLAAFTAFLTAYTHSLLYLRTLYPRTSFVHSRFHNTSVYQSRHPLVCEWIRDAIAAVRDELLAGSIARIAIVVFTLGQDSSAAGTDAGSAKILERYMFDVSRFPVVDRAERAMEIEWDSFDGAHSPPGDVNDAESTPDTLDTNLSEQFRAALIALTTRTAQLTPLPSNCSFNISMELKDEAAVDPPIGHPMPWVPVQPSLQKTGRKGAVDTEEKGEGKDLGGVRVTPIRSVEAGVFRFETWVEEGRAKFEQARTKLEGLEKGKREDK